MCDLRPWRLGLPGWVPKSLVSPSHLKFSCRIWDTSSWHWIPLGSTSLTGSDTPSHSVTTPPIPHTLLILPIGVCVCIPGCRGHRSPMPTQAHPVFPMLLKLLWDVCSLHFLSLQNSHFLLIRRTLLSLGPKV